MYKFAMNSGDAMRGEEEVEAAFEAIRQGTRPADLESGTLDFKQEGRSRDDAIREVAQECLCFANSHGGVVVVGVADKLSGAQAFVGTTIDPHLLQRRIYELSRPPLVVEVRPVAVGGATLLVVFVPPSPEIHADPQGRAPRRIGTACVPMDPIEQMRLREDRRGIDWSGQPGERTRADVSPAALRAARERLAGLPDERRALARLSDDDLLRALNLVAPDGRLLHAGEVLLCPTDATAVVYQYRATPGGEPRAVERIGTPLVLALQRTLELIEARRNTTPLLLPNGQVLAIADFPELAVREALANAVMHRDYHLADPVHVEHSPEVFVVTSPGPLVSGVTPQNILTHPSKPRNAALARAIRLLGLAEEVGRGVDRIYREMIRAGRGLPGIESEPARVRVSLAGGAPDTHLARFVALLPPEERDDTDTLLVLFRLCDARTVQAASLAGLLQKSEAEAEAVLRRLASDTVGVLEPTRESARRAHPAYRLRAGVLKALGPAVRYHRRTVDEIDRKLVGHVEEYGKITNRTVQNLLDVTVQRARGILADLVRRGVLVRTSAHQRGPGVEYGAGPAFPARRRKR
jgi:ATP-dependent DNA helicase RecG